MKKLVSLIMSIVFLFLVSCQKEEFEATVKPEAQSGLSDVEMAFPGETGVIEKGYLFGTPIEYAKINGQAVFQGDIILTPEQLSAKPNENLPNGRVAGAARSNLASRWPNNTVYYTVSSTLPAESKTRVSDAIAHWQANSSVKFVVRTTEANYVTFRSGNGCSSHVGMIGNQQFIDISTACSTGNIIHEIGHALGVWHEQSRADRDSFIKILWDNITSGKEHNFKTYTESGNDGFDYGAFDFGSIMMYGPYSFSKNGLATITKKDGSTYSVQRTALSAGDKSIINLMYFSWKKIPGGAKDIGVGADGTVYVIGSAAVPGGYEIFKWNGSGWVKIPGGAVRVAVSPQGVPWVINSSGEIFKLSSGVWQKMPGAAKDIGIGANGTVYVIGVAAVAGGYEIFRWNGSGWAKIPGGAVRIAVNPVGLPGVVNSFGEIFSLSLSGTWIKHSGAGKDIAFDTGGSMYVIGADAMPGGYGIYKKQGAGWYKLPGAAVAISAGPKGTPWVVNSYNGIFQGLSLSL